MTYREVAREVARKLAALGCREAHRRGDGSHRKWYHPATKAGTAVPDRGGRDLKYGTIRGAVRQFGLSRDEFENA